MRASRRFAQKRLLWKWDVFERPYWSWDVYERPVYVWDVYERVATSWEMTQIHEEDLVGQTFNVPYTGGYYRGGYHSFSATGKHSIDSNGRSEITSALTTVDMTSDLFSTQAGFANLDVLYQAPAFDGYIVKNTALGRFEITNCQYAWGINPLSYGKGAAAGTTVTSFADNAYPANGYDAVTEKYYVRRTMVLVPTGNTAESFADNTYPLNGYHVASELWYIRTTYTKTPTNEIAFSVCDDTYPAAGYHEATNLWYERRVL